MTWERFDYEGGLTIWQRECPDCDHGLLLAPARFCPRCDGTGYLTTEVDPASLAMLARDAPMTRPPRVIHRFRLIRRIGSIWRGDWSGTMFDGRDGQRWLETAIDGDEAALAALESELAAIEDSYWPAC